MVLVIAESDERADANLGRPSDSGDNPIQVTRLSSLTRHVRLNYSVSTNGTDKKESA